jgi:hypothetical protein
MVFAEQLQQRKLGFARGGRNVASFPKSTEWQEGKVKVVINNTETQLTGLVLRRGSTPADGIREFFGANGSNAQIDCASFQSVVSRRALLEVLGERAYNRRYQNVGVAGLHVKDDPFDFAIFPIRGSDGIIPGMSLRWNYPSGEGGEYENENTICIIGEGDSRLYVGHPFAKPYTEKGMTAEIVRRTGIKGTRPDLATSIEWKQLPK